MNGAEWTAAAGDIRSEIDAELESHLELYVERRVGDGVEAEVARAEAEAHFGDRGKIALACLQETKEGRTMNGKHLFTAGALLLLAVGLFVTLARSRQYQAAALQARMEMESARMSIPFFKKLEPVSPEEIKAYVGGKIRVVDRHGENPTFTGEYQVQRDGHILLPGIGWFNAAGKSRPTLETELRAAYSLIQTGLTLDVIVEDPLLREMD